MKRILVLILALWLLAVPVFAQVEYVCDNSNLLTQSEIDTLEMSYSKSASKYGFDTVYLTVGTFGSLSPWEFAHAYYDATNYSENCVLLLLSVQEGYWYIMTSGTCSQWLSEDDISEMGMELLPLFISESYYDSAVRFLELTEDYYKEDNNGKTGQTKVSNGVGKVIGVSVGVGLLIGAVTVLIMALPMKTVKKKHTAADYVRRDSMMLAENRDVFLYSRVSRTAKPKNQPQKKPGNHSRGGRGGAGGKL